MLLRFHLTQRDPSVTSSALLLPQRVRVLSRVYRGRRSHLTPARSGSGNQTRSRAGTGPSDHESDSGAAVAGEDLHGAGDGLEGTVPEVVEGLLVQVVLLLAQALLEQLALVPELDHRLGVGVEGGDGGSHAAGEGAPGHASSGAKNTEKWRRSGRKSSNVFSGQKGKKPTWLKLNTGDQNGPESKANKET